MSNEPALAGGAMRTKYFLLVLFWTAAVFITGCAADDSSDESDESDGSDESDTPDDDQADDDATPDDDAISDDDATPPCDDTLRPIVFIHGFLEVGDAFADQAMRFASNGYCLERIYTFDYDTLFNYHAVQPQLEKFVDAVLAETGAAQVDLLGHSMGGDVAYTYLQDAARAAKVAHYAQLASFAQGPIPHGVPTINICSEADTMAGVSQIPGAQNIVFDDLDHLQVATSDQTFIKIYRFFNQSQDAATSEIAPEENIIASGRLVVFAENSPAAEWSIQIYEVDSATGERTSNVPLVEFTSDPQGYWGDFQAQPEAYYEFVCRDPDGVWPPVHYYREPFKRSNNKVYFRVFPPRNSLLGWAFRLLPLNDRYAIFAWLGLNQSVLLGRDALTVNGLDLATAAMAAPEITTIAIFFFDANFNGVSDQQVAGGLYSAFPFMRVFDLRLAADPPQPINFVFNDRPLTLRNWPSRTEGVAIAAFE